MARTEAIRSNEPAQFLLTNTSPAASDVANTAAPNTVGPNWLVRVVTDPAGPTYQLIDSKAGSEGEGQSGAPAVAIAGSGPAGFDGSITFNSLGGTADSSPYSIDVTNPSGGTCASAGGPMRCRRIVVTPG